MVTSYAKGETFLNCKVKVIRSDNETKFVNYNFKSFCEQKGIRHKFTNIYTLEQDRIIKSFNQIFADGMRLAFNNRG